ncbi:MAG: DNA polymerase I, partial [Clostridia bacterium]|nr:DNA polymerase I [Clostridia bacterium]
GYKVVEKEGYEADDILGTLSAQCKGEDLCFIATGDRDSLQLVSDNTRVLLASTKMGKAITTVYDQEKLMEEYGVEPKGTIEIKALMGDSSDNIPGVAGVGQKTAGDLIKNYGSIDYIYEHIEEIDIKKGVHDKLIAGKDMAYLSRQLGTICLEAPVDLDMDSYLIGEGDLQKALSLLVSLEMFGIIEKLGLTREKIQPVAEKEAEKKPYKEERDLPLLLGRIKDEAYFLTEYADDGSVSKLYFSFEDGGCYAGCDCFDFSEFLTAFLSSECKKYTSDVKALYKYALKKGIELKNVMTDTALAGYILNPSASSYEPDRLCEEYSCLSVAEYEGEDRLKADVAVSFRALCKSLDTLIDANGQRELFSDIEIPLAKVLADMENTGFLVDKKGIEDFGEALAEKIQKLTDEIYEEAGFEFNINSPKQLGVALFERLNIPCKKKTKSGYSTNADVLEELAQEYPVVAHVLEYRTLAKLRSTYCEGLIKVIDSDGRIRSTLNQTETRTGRISSTEPNLQNIPVRSELGREMRRFFTAGEGRCLVDADYSQIELRVLAHLSDDSTMIEGFNNGEDIHAITASQVFNMPLFMVTPLMRSRAKAVNFGIVYGIGAFSLAKDIGVTRKEADNYIKGYLHHYSAVRAYLERVVEKARDDGYVSTVFGRRRYLPELTASNKMLQAFGERVAKNAPVQGTAADIIKIAMVRVYERLKKENLDARLIMQVHDELIVECSEEDRQAAEIILKQEMENACKMKVKLLADVHSGKTWYDAKG